MISTPAAGSPTNLARERSGAVGAGVGGIGACLAAVFAWLSAKASRATGRDALEALAVGIKPTIGVHTKSVGRPTWLTQLDVYNASGWPARKVHVEMRYRDGRTVAHDRHRFDSGDPHWFIDMPDITQSTVNPLDSSGTAREIVEAVVIAYSDDREIARYQMLIPASPRRAPFTSNHCTTTRIV